MRAFHTAILPPLRSLQQSTSPAQWRARSSVAFKSQLYNPHARVSINNNNVYLRALSTTRPRLQLLTPQPTSPPSESVEIISGKLTAPRSSLPGALEIPERVKGDSTLGYYFKVGKGYLSFYKTGLKNVFRNFKASRGLQKRIDDDGKGSITELVEKGRITRGEFQFVMRTRHDSRRIPLFALLFLVCGEFTPLVVVIFSSIVPFPCRIPKQINSDTTKLHQRRSAAFTALASPPTTTSPVPTSTPTATSTPTTIPSILDLSHLTNKQLMHVAVTLNLAPSFSSIVSFPYLLQRRVARRIEYLELDDVLLERFGGVDELVRDGGRQELEWAAMERGIDTIDRSDEELKGALRRWFEERRVKGRVLPEMFFERR